MDLVNKLMTPMSVVDYLSNNSERPVVKNNIKKTAEDFASVFINELLQSVRKEKICEKSMFDNSGTELSKKMYFEKISHILAHGSKFSLSDQIEQSLVEQGKNHD